MKNQLLNIDKIINDGGCEVYTPTKRVFEQVLELSERSGIRWMDGSLATDDKDVWLIYKEETVLALRHIVGKLILLFGSLSDSDNAMTILEFLNLYCIGCDVDVSDLL